MSRAFRLSLCGCVAATCFAATPQAQASCAGVRADAPQATTKTNGAIVVTGFGGGFFCASGATASVCLDLNGVTRVDTCRTYTGTAPNGPTGEAPCATGVWLTQVVVIPNTGSPTTAHSLPFVQVCPVGDT